MKFRTRLQITFLSIVLLPLLFTAIAFLGITFYILHYQQGMALTSINYDTMTDALPEHGIVMDEITDKFMEQIDEDVSVFDSEAYFKKVKKEIGNSSVDFIVRKGDELFYSTDPRLANRIFTYLPIFKEHNIEEAVGEYSQEIQRYVRQIDFLYPDGSTGSIFVMTRMSSLISGKMLLGMFVAITIILLAISIGLTKWIQKGVFEPVRRLNFAMKNIKEGNLDYVLESDGGDEISELYRNYEDMRLRLKESEEEKLENERANRELISNISHDLKTPITAVKGYVEGIMDGVADTPEKMDKYIKTIYSKANDMDKLINELTTYSGIDNNRISYNFHRINVSDYFGDCVEEVGLELEAEGIKLNYSNMVPQDTVVIADPEQMKKVINNIISNSIKYSDKDDGEIDIRILDRDDAIQVDIEDNGKGIAAKDLPRIFERFYRTDASRNSMKGGSGIGLSIVKKIIEDHGGYIWATSKEGEGTCMHFVIRKYKELEF